MYWSFYHLKFKIYEMKIYFFMFKGRKALNKTTVVLAFPKQSV